MDFKVLIIKSFIFFYEHIYIVHTFLHVIQIHFEISSEKQKVLVLT